MDNTAETQTSVRVQPSTDNAEDRLQLLKSRLTVAKKWAKKPHDAWREYIREYKIEDVSDTSEIRDRVRIGYIFRKTESEIPAIFDDQPELFIKGRTKDYQVIEDIYNSAYDMLWDKQNLEEKIEDAGIYFELLGMSFITSPYVTKTKKVVQMVDQPVTDPATGETLMNPDGTPATEQTPQEYEVPIYDLPDATVEDPFKLFFSPETQFSYRMDAENCPHYFKKHSWTPEKINAMFGKKVDAQEKLFTDDSDVDGEIKDEMNKATSEDIKGDFNRVTVYEYYGTLPENMIKGIKDAGAWEYDKEYHIYFTNNEELQAEECPYTRKPLFVIGNYGMANEFWKFGDAKHLKPLVQELEQYRSQILMHTRKMANPKPLIELNSDVDEQAFSDPRVGKPVKYQGIAPAYLSPANLGKEVEVGVDMVRTDLEKTAGSFDLENGSSQSSVRTPRGIQVFSEAADKSVRRKRKKVARLIKQLIIFQFEQIGDNWKPDENKSLEIDGKQEPITDQILQVLKDPDLLDKVDIEVESLSLNRVQMKQDALDLIDLALKSEAQAPGYINLDAVWRDVFQNGFNKRDADRYMIPEEQRQAMQQAMAQEKPNVSVSVRADAATPEGVQLLQNNNLITPEQANIDVVHQEQQQAQDQQMQQEQQAFQQEQAGKEHELAQQQQNHQQEQAQVQNQQAEEKNNAGFLQGLMKHIVQPIQQSGGELNG